MSLTVAYAALATGIIVWLILVRKLSAKSWEAQPATGALADDEEPRWPAARVGLWVFLAVVTSLFGLFVSAYSMRLSGHHGSGPATDWVQLSEPPVLWLNTVLLIAASVAMQAAASPHPRRQRRAQSQRTARRRPADARVPRRPVLRVDAGARVGVLLAAESRGRLLLSADCRARPAPARRSVRVGSNPGPRCAGRTSKLIDVRLSLELCSVYWHFLLLVWLGCLR